jgi:hypothetical protein
MGRKMNDKERVRDLMSKIDSYRGFHKYGCIRVHAESKKHFMAKCEKVWEIHSIGHKFATEVLMKDKSIFDVVDLETGETWEFETSKKEDKKRGTRIQL